MNSQPQVRVRGSTSQKNGVIQRCKYLSPFPVYILHTAQAEQLYLTGGILYLLSNGLTFLKPLFAYQAHILG